MRPQHSNRFGRIAADIPRLSIFACCDSFSYILDEESETETFRYLYALEVSSFPITSLSPQLPPNYLELERMCDAASIFASMVLAALSVLPGNQYILFALLPVLLLAHIANGQWPKQKFDGVNHAIDACKELLEGAKLGPDRVL
jgi:hypothetical protein